MKILIIFETGGKNNRKKQKLREQRKYGNRKQFHKFSAAKKTGDQKN